MSHAYLLLMMLQWFSRVAKSDYYTLTRFLFPLSFTVIAVDIGEQFLNRSVARSTNVVDVLAAFGLGYTIVKVLVGVLGEVRHAGLVLVHDRNAYRKMLLFTIIAGSLFAVLLIITATTQLGVWLIRDLHRVSETVSDLTQSSLIYMCVYPLIDAIIFSVTILLYTPMLCHTPIALPILAAYGGVVTRCTIILSGFICKVYPNIRKEIVTRLTMRRIISFLSPLMFTIFIQRISRPIINLIVARSSPSRAQAAEAVAVLTASYPLGHLPYGWLNTLKPVPPAFQQKKTGSNRPVIAGKKIAIFSASCLAISAVVSFALGWIPGVSVALLEKVVAIPHHLALLCVTPLRIFTFFCFTGIGINHQPFHNGSMWEGLQIFFNTVVSVRASVTGWLIVHQQTKLVAPSGFIRLAAIISALFILPQLGVNGADSGVGSLFSGFLMEMLSVTAAASFFLCWKKCKSTSRQRSIGLVSSDTQNKEVSVELTELTTLDKGGEATANAEDEKGNSSHAPVGNDPADDSKTYSALC